MKFFIPKGLFIISLLLTATIVFSQKDSIAYFFDKDFNSCKQENLIYIGFGVKENRMIKFTNYIGATGMLVMEGYFTDSTLAVKQGLFTYYDDSGYKIS